MLPLYMPLAPSGDRDSSLTTSPQILGARQDQEDRYITLTPGSLKSRKDLALFAVYDGQ
jgi:protein phosphatase 2C family protein 2/3